MNKELIFAKNLESLRNLAKEQGNMVSETQVQEAFADLDLAPQQLQLVYDYLLKHKVGIGQPVNVDDYLTAEEKDYLQDYLEELRLLPQYRETEKEGYLRSAMAGDALAQSKVIEMHLKDVVDVAKLYAGQGVGLEDLIGEGNVALTMGVSMLGSMETPGEAQGMLGKLMMDAMEEYIAVQAENEKTDKRVEDRVNQVAEKAKELAQELQRKVTIEELAQETGISKKRIAEAIRMSGYKIDEIAP